MRVRASSWATLFDCAYKWEGVHLLGMESYTNPRAHLGKAIHASTAVFDLSRLNQEGLTADDTASIAIEHLNDDADVDWDSDSLGKVAAKSIAYSLHYDYCTKISPNYDFVAVEMDTQPMQIDCGDNVVIELTGTLDRSRVKRENCGYGISDLKTGVQAVQKGRAKTKGHRAQLGVYELLFEYTSGLKITQDAEIIGLKTTGNLDIATGLVQNAKQLLIGEDQEPGLIEYAKEFFRSGLFPPNPSSMLCSKKYCPRWERCKYHD